MASKGKREGGGKERPSSVLPNLSETQVNRSGGGEQIPHLGKTPLACPPRLAKTLLVCLQTAGILDQNRTGMGQWGDVAGIDSKRMHFRQV